MMRRQRVNFYFNSEDGSTLCVINTKHKTYVGTAQCSPQDMDMLSEKTGGEIAFHRAKIHMITDQKDILTHELDGLLKYYYSIRQSKKFNKKDYAVRMLIRQIKIKQNDIDDLNELLTYEKETLKQYMEQKAIFYNRIRESRKGKNN